MIQVAPFAGAWVEIASTGARRSRASVAPFAGAWVEIPADAEIPAHAPGVAPFAGAWVEIYSTKTGLVNHTCRTLRGCVG